MSLPAPMPPLVSVVICTRNRPDTILQAVTSVLANNHPAFDVIVIDQSTSPATGRILSPIVAMDPRLRYLHVEEPGLSRAYNTGTQYTQGELLAFTDDDCEVPPDWLQAISRAFSADADADLLYGQVLPPPDEPPGGIVPALRLERHERLSQRTGFRIIGMGANFAARRRLFEAIGGFDVVLGGGGPLCSSQDYDLAYRAFRAGRVILLCPEVKLIHYGRRTYQDWPATLRAYGIGDGGFYFKHIRCLDLYALCLLAQQIAVQTTRVLAHRLRGQRRMEMIYVRHVLIGIRKCLQFDIDRRMRLYIPQ
jgi:glycosyltransferase involved in cell wall biosynthesis